MICPQCHAPLPDGSTFCGNCGVSLAIKQQPYAQQQQYAQPQQQYAQPQQQYAQLQQQFAQPQQQYAQPQQQYAQPQQQYAQPQQQYAQPQQQYAQPQQQYAQPQQQYAQPQQQYAQPQQQFAQPQQQYAQPQYGNQPYGQPQYAMPYGGMAPAKKKSNAGLLIGILAGSVVVIAGVVFLLIFLLSGVHGVPYKTKLSIAGDSQTFDGTYSGGWKEDPSSTGTSTEKNGKPEGNGTLEAKTKMSGIELNCKVSGNWTDGKLNGDNCSVTGSLSSANDSVKSANLEIKGKFENGKMISGTGRLEANATTGERSVVTFTVENGRDKDFKTQYYDKDGKELK